jgi:hypothetical protein
MSSTEFEAIKGSLIWSNEAEMKWNREKIVKRLNFSSVEWTK